MEKVIRAEVDEVLRTTMDPELGIDLWTLGLIYNVDFDEAKQKLGIKMTFTTPLCPYGPQIVGDLKGRFRALGLEDVTVDVVFDPPWEPSEDVRAMLGV
ncbi:MAG: putative iron sulfur cluster assembly protein [Candidatus Parcubacteria bacterium]|jgi:metal-sulfur cluster biosynthetic enzyme